jgi:ATP-dependent Clp protease ATP-binding subunit ClpA
MKAMQREQLLNSLSQEAREALDNAKRLALWKGGLLTPLHLTVALLEYLMATTTQASGEAAHLLQTAHEALNARYPDPYQGASITITKETQGVIAEANTIASDAGKSLVAPLHLLYAAMESENVKAALIDARQRHLGLQALEQNFQNPTFEPLAERQSSSTPSPEAVDIPAKQIDARLTAPLSGVLAEFCSNLAEESLLNSAHQFVGREREMTAVLETLCRKLKNNPLLIGKPGVGKTALVTAVAARLRDGQVPVRLQGKRVLEVSRLRLLADAKFSGDIEERLKCLIEEVKRAGDVILFFDEIHTLLSAGGAGGVGDIANLLKSALSKGEVTCIGATTLAEYYKYIARDEALARRFSTITIEEPSPEETRRILLEARVAFETHHDIKIDDAAIALIIDLADRYLHARSFPDKAFDLMDKAAAKATLAGQTILSRECVTEALSETTGLPLEIMNENPAERLERLEAFLNALVPGQARASRDIARVVRLAKLRLELRPERPDGVFLFVGVEGAGKHEMASALAKFLYGSSKKMIDFDMSQFTENWSLSRLVGAEPGYVGYGERSGLLSKAAEDNPHSVLYFRNVDLAHPVVQQFLGEAFEQGSFTDAAGTRISLSNTTVIISLSQIGEHNKHTLVGFHPHSDDGEARPITGNLKLSGSLKLRERGSGYNVIEPLAAAIDEVIEFQVLDREAIEKIIAERLEALKIRLEAAQPVTVQIDAGLVSFFAEKLRKERKSLAQLERLWQETILIPFTNLHPNKYPSDVRVEISICVEDNCVKVAAHNGSPQQTT